MSTAYSWDHEFTKATERIFLQLVGQPNVNSVHGNFSGHEYDCMAKLCLPSYVERTATSRSRLTLSVDEDFYLGAEVLSSLPAMTQGPVGIRTVVTVLQHDYPRWGAICFETAAVVPLLSGDVVPMPHSGGTSTFASAFENADIEIRSVSP